MTALLYSSLQDEQAMPLGLSNRGLCYGDGLFETIRVCDSIVPLVDYHRERFQSSCNVLGFDATSALQSFDATLGSALNKLAELEHSDALIKIFAIRSEGGRGYAPSPQSHPDFYFQVFESPSYPVDFSRHGVDVKLCTHRLSEQPVLAGIKHLNRLDQVLASRELNGMAEGLVLDAKGQVIEGTKSNLLVFTEDEILTPKIETCGVAGVLRAAILDSREVPVHEAHISLDDLNPAKGLALINSVFGLWPVRCFEGKTLPIAAACRSVQSYISEQFGFPE
jgi:4-amino-4-deoxychorismate lyase